MRTNVFIRDMDLGVSNLFDTMRLEVVVHGLLLAWEHGELFAWCVDGHRREVFVDENVEDGERRFFVHLQDELSWLTMSGPESSISDFRWQNSQARMRCTV